MNVKTMKKWQATITNDFGETYQTVVVEAVSYTMALFEVWDLGSVTELVEVKEDKFD